MHVRLGALVAALSPALLSLAVTRAHGADWLMEDPPPMEDDALMVTATQTLVLVDLDERRAQPIPDTFKSVICRFEGDDVELAAPMC